MEENISTRQHILKNTDRKLIVRMRIFAVIFLITFIIAMVETIVYKAPVRFIIISFVI